MSVCTCGKRGDFTFPLSVQFFCVECFSKKFERRFLSNIPRSLRGHSLVVAFSGGKDSSTLLYILNKYRKKLKIPVLSVITLDEENPTTQESRNKIIDISRKRYPNVTFIQFSYSELFGFSLPKLILQSDRKKMRFTPCTICGVLRRHAILRLALEIDADYIAMGNTLNDEAATMILNILRAKPEKNIRNEITFNTANGRKLPNRIKPLARFFEKTIRNYCAINEIQPVKTNCSYENRSLRFDINSFLLTLEKKDPNLLFNIVSSGRKFKTNNTKSNIVMKCQNCNSYSTRHECSACSLVRKIMS